MAETNDPRQAFIRALQGTKLEDTPAVGPMSVPPTGSPTQDAIGNQMLADINEQEAMGQIDPLQAISARQDLGISQEAQGLPLATQVQDANLDMVQNADPAAQVVQTAMADIPGVSNALPLPAPLQPVPGTPTREETTALELARAQEAEAALANQKIENDAILANKQAAEAQRAAASKEARQAEAEVRATAQVQKQDEAAATAPSKVDDEEGLSLRQAFAILLGGISQGLTGAKTNPAIDMLDAIRDRRMKRLAAEAEAQKLSEEQKIAREKLELQKQEQILREAESRQNNELTRAKIAELGAKVGQEKQVLEQKQYLLAKQSGSGGGTPGLTTQELQTLVDPKEQGLYMRYPGTDTWFRGINEKSAEKVREEITAASTAIQDLKRLKELNKKYGNNFLSKAISFTDKAEADAVRQGIIGGIRLEYFGPGVLSDKEQDLARQIIRRPTDVLSLASSNEASLNAILRKLNFGIREKMRNQGADVPVVGNAAVNEKNIATLMKAGKAFTKGDAANVLIKTGRWLDESE